MVLINSCPYIILYIGIELKKLNSKSNHLSISNMYITIINHVSTVLKIIIYLFKCLQYNFVISLYNCISCFKIHKFIFKNMSKKINSCVFNNF